MGTVLSIYPNTFGFGYVCIALPNKLSDYGVVEIKPASNEIALKRITKYIEYFKPKYLVLRDCSQIKNSDRLQNLEKEIKEIADRRDIPVYTYSQSQNKNICEIYEASNKYVMAQKIAQEFPELKHRVPKKRKDWHPEPYNVPLFDALALAITHAYLK